MLSTAILFVLCTLLLELVRQVEAWLPDNSTWGVGQGHSPPSVWGVQLGDVGPTVYTCCCHLSSPCPQSPFSPILFTPQCLPLTMVHFPSDSPLKIVP